MKNIEIKAAIKNLHNIIDIAKKLSASEGIVIKQEDTFFNVIQGRLKLRVFESGDGELIYYERPNIEGPKLSSFEKTEIPRDHVDGLHNVLEAALGSKHVVRKIRRLFLVGQTRIHIDTVEGLGDFMELEVCLKDDQSVEEGERIAEDLMEKLQVHKDNLISGAYVDLLSI
nr:unnamed protein product [Callosobruchus analis]